MNVGLVLVGIVGSFVVGFGIGLMIGHQLVENLRSALAASRGELIKEKARAEGYAARLAATENRVVNEAKAAVVQEVEKL